MAEPYWLPRNKRDIRSGKTQIEGKLSSHLFIRINRIIPLLEWPGEQLNCVTNGCFKGTIHFLNRNNFSMEFR